jgi:molecular chaperone HscB
MICWSCQKEAGSDPLCQSCRAIQPPTAGITFFEALGLPRSFLIDPVQLEERLKDLSRQLHPDRFAQKSPRERRMSLEWTTTLNDAHRTLMDPLRRAVYLLRSYGVDVDKESGKGVARALPPTFLEEILELRETLAEAKARKDLGKVRDLSQGVARRSADLLEKLSDVFRKLESHDDSDLVTRASEMTVALKYFHRFAEEVESIEMEALESS